MLFSINMRIINNNINIIDIESLDLEINLDAGGGIEGIKVDDREPTDVEAQVIADNLQEIQEEILWQFHQHNKFKDNSAWQGTY